MRETAKYSQSHNAEASLHDDNNRPKYAAHRDKSSLITLVYWVILMLYLEYTFRLFAYDAFFSKALVFTGLFALLSAVILYFFTSLFPKKLNFGIAVAITFSLCIYYSAQFVYLEIFSYPFTLFSVQNAGQIIEFSDFIKVEIKQNTVALIIFILPLIFVSAAGLRLIGFFRAKKLARAASAVSAFALYGLCVLIIFLSGTGVNSLYSLYFKTNVPQVTQQKLGVLTTGRLDAQRRIFGFDEQAEDENEELIREIIQPAAAQPDPSPDEPEPKPNIMEIDFDKLIAATADKTLKDMDAYFSKVIPTMQNKHTGLFKGDNLILITAESFSTLAVSQKYTPTLYKLMSEGIRFNNFYNPGWGVSTSDGEYVACAGLIPKSGVWSMYKSGRNAMPFFLGNQFLKLGSYGETFAYHNNTYNYYRRDISHPNMGYTYKALGKGLILPNPKDWPQSDLEMIDATVPDFINQDKFHAYYMTVSGHMIYSYSGNRQAVLNREAVYDLNLPEACQSYVACNITLDKAMESLLKHLENAGKLDNTVITISGDHTPYGLTREEKDILAGKTLEGKFEVYKSTLIIWKNKLAPITVDKPVSSLDILPTLSNLFGLEYDSRLLMGRDALSDSEGLVMLSDRSFITDRCFYNAGTGAVTAFGAEKLPSREYVDEIKKMVSNKFSYSAKILDKNYYVHIG